MPYLRLMRPHQWVKNVFVFAGVIFGGKLGDPAALLTACAAFGLLSLVSSAIYVFNDIKDRDEDRLHPRKCKRPIAAGQVSPTSAALVGLASAVIGLGGAYLLHRGFFLLAVAYFLLQLAYTFRLKRVVLLDVIIIAIGFVLRAVSGAAAVNVEISVWLVLCTFTLCLFMGFSKRRCELTMLENGGQGDAAKHRATLARYTPELLNHMTTVAAGIAIISFMLYATDPATREKFHSMLLPYTLPLVVYAVFRFALLVEHGRVDGPTDVVLRDRPFQAAVILWGAAALAIIYRGQAIQAWLQHWVQTTP